MNELKTIWAVSDIYYQQQLEITIHCLQWLETLKVRYGTGIEIVEKSVLATVIYRDTPEYGFILMDLFHIKKWKECTHCCLNCQ